MNLFGIFSDLFKSIDAIGSPINTVDTRDRWHLMLGQKLLGELVFCSYETPWITADFSPSDDFPRFIPYFEWGKRIDACIDNDTDEEDPTEQVITLIDEINSIGKICVVDLKTKKTWAPTLHFGDDYSYVTFR